MICPGRIILIVLQLVLFLVAGINIYQTVKELISGSSNGDFHTLVFPSIIFMWILTKWVILPLTKKPTKPVKAA